MKKLQRVFIFLFLIIFSFANAQEDRLAKIETKLKELSKETPGLNEKVELSVNGSSIQEFIRGIAITNNVNVSVDPTLSMKIYNNFTNVTVSDVFLFLCKKYDLDITFIGNIMSFTTLPQVKPEPVKYVAKELKIKYDNTLDLITFDFSNDSIAQIARALTVATKKNVVFAPELNGKVISGYIENLPFSKAMEKLAFANDLSVTLNDDVYLLEKKETAAKANKPADGGGMKLGNGSTIKVPEGLILKRDGDSQYLLADAVNVPISDILSYAFKEMNLPYFLFSDIKGNATLRVSNVSFPDFLKLLLNGTDYTFKKQDDIYLLGDRNIEGLRITKVIAMKHRAVSKVIDFIPPELKKGVEIKTFGDLNSLILSGSQIRIEEIESFLFDIDKVVPVITIEVLVVDVRDTKTLATGLSAGLGTAPVNTSGTLMPGIDMTFSSTSINNLLSGLNGFGVVNLGNVTPNFYFSLKALESRGIIKLRSTPQIATLNGNEAKLSVGQQQYYLEVSNNVIGAQNPQNIISQNYKSVNADLAITVNPSVSGDEQITLEINVKQSSFTERINPSAPPGTITRDFKSMIRVKNQEMIVLGGLEENSLNDTGSGLPLLYRIPVLKWLFGNRTKSKSNNKLTIFVRPTVLY
jgi:type IV pilus assembly protein PilQ